MATPTQVGDETERRCAVTRAVRPVGDLIRFVADPDRNVVPDIRRRLPGRGVSVTGARDIVEAAVARGVFERGLRRPVRVPEALPALVDALLVEAALRRLSLANKAGEVTTGFVKIADAIETGAAIRLLHAREAAPDGRRKLDGKLGARRPAATAIDCFGGEQLSLALGRPNVVHAAVTGGGASIGFLAAAARLEKYRAGSAAFAAA